MEMLPLAPSSAIQVHDWFQFVGIAGAIIAFWQVMRAIRKEKDSDIVFRTVVREKLDVLENQHQHDHPSRDGQHDAAWMPWVLMVLAVTAILISKK